MSEGLRKDPAWKYAYLADPNDRRAFTCNFCGKVSKGGVYRVKQHLLGGFRDVLACKKCPQHVEDEINGYMNKKKMEKEQVNLLPDFNDGNLNDEEYEAMEIVRVGKRVLSSSGSSRLMSDSSMIQSKSKKAKKRFIDAYCTVDPEVAVQNKTVEKGKRATINEPYKKVLREQACKQFARWMYDAGIPLTAVNYDSFAPMIEAIARCGEGMKPPSYYKVRVPLLKQEKENINELMKRHKEDWVKYGCTIMADGLTDRREMTFINFLVNCPRGTVFMESIDASSDMQTGEKIFELLDNFVECIGEANVVHVVTDNTPNNVLAGRLLEVKRPHLYWTPCATHCLDLILEDIGKIPRIKRMLKMAVSLSGFIYSYTSVLNIMRKFSKKELLRPAKTRFATAFLTLSSIYGQQNNLKKVFTSDEWTNSKWAKDQKGKRAYGIVSMPSFWDIMFFSLQVSGPIVRVLRLVNGEKKPPMGYIYKAMDKAKEAIANAFNGDKDKCKEIFDIIDRWWECQLHRPLHAAGYYLNPKFFYKNESIERDVKIVEGLYNCIQRLVPNPENQDRIMDELTKYKRADGLLGIPLAIRHRDKFSPVEWWHLFGASTPNLKDFAIRVLSLTCNSSGSELKSSVFEQLHCKKRNRLAQRRLNDLVFIRYNRTLFRRYKIRDKIDPISVQDIDDSNEWLIGKMEQEDDVDDELEFGGESLTLDDVARTSEIGESSHSIKAITLGYLNEEEEEEEDDEEEEDYFDETKDYERHVDSYESYNGEDERDAFVDSDDF